MEAPSHSLPAPQPAPSPKPVSTAAPLFEHFLVIGVPLEVHANLNDYITFTVCHGLCRNYATTEFDVESADEKVKHNAISETQQQQ